jgi:hypothetical protein
MMGYRLVDIGSRSFLEAFRSRATERGLTDIYNPEPCGELDPVSFQDLKK